MTYARCLIYAFRTFINRHPATCIPRCFLPVHKRDRMVLDAANPKSPQPLIAPPEFTSSHRCFLAQLRTFNSPFTRPLTVAEVLGLQEFESVVQFGVRYSRGLGHDTVIKHLHNSSPPPQKSASAGKHWKAPGPPVMIAYVPDSPPKCHLNRYHRVMGATGSGKTSVSWSLLIMIRCSLSCRPVCQSRKSFESTDRNELGIVYRRGPTRG